MVAGLFNVEGAETCAGFFQNNLHGLFVACITGMVLTTSLSLAESRSNMVTPECYESTPRRGYPVCLEPSGVLRAVPPTGIKKGTTVDAGGNTFDFNSQYFLKNGEPWLPVMGEMHYSRIPYEWWGGILDKAKASGVNIITTYVFWIHHEEEEGVWDWSGNKNLGAFLDLCQQKGLQVVLRIGPWCHGEVRNGGFPDWLLNKGFKLRSADPGYLEACHGLYSAISKQAAGRYFKDGGPVVGIQIENEYGWKEKGQIEYMMALKKMAVDLGMGVPVYTQFSPTYPPGQTEFLTTKGGYCDAPWGKGTQRQVREYNYKFKGITFDAQLGADLFGEREDTVSSEAFPLAMAEFGGGFQVTYHRRPRVFPGDIAAGAYVKIGSGANLIGYYMFHGGSNPPGKITTLQESRATGYPNDVPIISYDFQAPIGEWGQAHEQLVDLRLLHLALNDFGDRIALMTAYLPSQKDSGDLRYAVRVLGDEGCVFFNNHTRYLPSPDIKGVQFAMKQQGMEGPVWPTHPITIPSDAYGFFPFGWKLADARLNWATAQPVCTLDNKDVKTWVFAAVEGVVPEYNFMPDTIRRQSTDGNLVQITTAGGANIQILTLSRAEALSAYKVRFGENEYMVLANAIVTTEANMLRFQLWEGRELRWQSYPALPTQNLVSGSVVNHFSVGTQTFPAATLSVKPVNKRAAAPMSEEMASQPQPGPLYGAEFKMVPGSTTWDLSISGDPAEGATDYLVEIEFNGDTIALYNHGKLVADDFQRGNPMRFLLNRVTDCKFSEAQLKLQIVPFTQNREVYLEEDALKVDGLTAGISFIRVTPVYESELQVGTLPPIRSDSDVTSIPLRNKY